MQVYRLVKAQFADTPFDGQGAKRYGGRWNSKGTPMVYTADSIALAALELLVHLRRSEVLNHFRLCTLEIPDDCLFTLAEDSLPHDWRNDPPALSTADIGDDWARDRGSLALAVPSTLIPAQKNLLINPLHHQLSELLDTLTVERFEFDPRLGHN